jgi:integrase/recombinase XerD
MRLNDAIDDYISSLRVQGYSERTLRDYRNCLRRFLSFLKAKGVSCLIEITTAHVTSYQRHLFRSSYSDKTIKGVVSVLRLFFRYAYQKGYIFNDLSLCLWTVRNAFVLPKSIFSEEEMSKVLSMPDVSTGRGIRDRAILELLYSSGIRNSELCSAMLYDLNISEALLRVIGKGNKQRVVPVGKVALYWIEKYLNEVRPYYLMYPREYHIFLNHKTGGLLKGRTVGGLVHEYARSSGIGKPLYPHAIRHACATHMLKHGADIRYIQQLLGHTHLLATQIYTHVEISDLKEVLKKYHPRGMINIK